jgi:hypothetical protein
MALPYSGTVPIMEAGMGMERAWARLPAIFVPSYANLSWPLLNQAWAEVLYNLPYYDFSHLSMRYWEVDVLDRVVRTGDAAFLDEVHPRPLRTVTRLLPNSLVVVCSGELDTRGLQYTRTCLNATTGRKVVTVFPVIDERR